VEGHVALGSIQDKQLGPDQAEESHLVRHLQLGKPRNIPGPLNRGEQYAGGKLTDVVQPDDITGMLLHVGVAGGRIWLRPHEQ